MASDISVFKEGKVLKVEGLLLGKGYEAAEAILEEGFPWFSSKCWLQLGKK